MSLINLSLLFTLLLMPVSGHSQNVRQYLVQYFSGSAFQFGYGSGTSSNNPRVELTIHYCSTGAYYSYGKSCRPNIIASGYQCSDIQDLGMWKIDESDGQGLLQWMSNTSGPGSLLLYVRNDGSVADQQGNPFQRIGPAQCN